MAEKKYRTLGFSGCSTLLGVQPMLKNAKFSSSKVHDVEIERNFEEAKWNPCSLTVHSDTGIVSVGGVGKKGNWEFFMELVTHPVG